MFHVGRDSESLRTGRSRNRILVGVRFSAPVRTGRGTHPASYTMRTRSFLGVQWQGMAMSTHPYLAPRLKKELRK
jgi:hypothetical protein